MTDKWAKTQNNNDAKGQAVPPLSLPSPSDKVFELAKQFMPYGFGSLWWGRDDLIRKAHKSFGCRKDRVGHPLLSVKRGEPQSRQDKIPMLVDTSGTKLRDVVKNRCVKVKALTAEEPSRISYFGSIICPGLYGFEDLLDGIVRKANSYRRSTKHGGKGPIAATEPVPWYELRAMHPNEFKSHVDTDEKKDLERFCDENGI